MATTNWGNQRLVGQARWVAVLACCLLRGPSGIGAEEDARPPDGARLARLAYQGALGRWQADTNDLAAAWQFGRACFDWAEFATNDTQRATLAREGIAACRQVVARQPKAAAGHYYLGMNLGQLARTKSLGALPLVNEMERVFRQARHLDAQFDRGGPDRNLGLLYLDAPGWPASIGSRAKAREHLERAANLFAAYPENRLNLLEACLRWGDQQTAARELGALTRLLPTARTNFAGADWAAAWMDWDKRWAAILAKTGARAR